MEPRIELWGPTVRAVGGWGGCARGKGHGYESAFRQWKRAFIGFSYFISISCRGLQLIRERSYYRCLRFDKTDNDESFAGIWRKKSVIESFVKATPSTVLSVCRMVRRECANYM